MGCFLSCFRGGSDPSGDLRDPLVRESRLGDAFLNDEKKFDEATGKPDAVAAYGHGVDEELRREANYLKSCGTISQTPPEILDSVPINSEDADECGDTPTNVQLMRDAVLLEENSSELLNSDEHDVSTCKEDIDEGTLGVGSETQSSLQDKPLYQNVRDQSTDSNDSPYPTPLVLSGDIQTPGTNYTAYKETSKPGKRTRASRQFIYPVLRPIENKIQWMELNDVQIEVMSPDEPKDQNINQQQDEGEHLLEQSSEYGKRGVTSLSHWLKPSSADDESKCSPDDVNVGKETWYGTSVSDVPIFPAFGLNWETDNPTPVLPKAWDGNGIPNTTTKYKEDQKVSWHATPFEERLLKVLSDEKPRHQRKISGKLIHLEENAE